MKARWDPDEMDALMLMALDGDGVWASRARGDFNMDAEGRLSRVPEQRMSPFV